MNKVTQQQKHFVSTVVLWYYQEIASFSQPGIRFMGWNLWFEGRVYMYMCMYNAFYTINFSFSFVAWFLLVHVSLFFCLSSTVLKRTSMLPSYIYLSIYSYSYLILYVPLQLKWGFL